MSYRTWISRASGYGWSFNKFYRWALGAEGIVTERRSTMLSQWQQKSGLKRYAGAIAGIADTRIVPKSWTRPPMYPGRQAEYTNVVEYRYRTEEGGPWTTENISVGSETQLRKGEILDWASERLVSDPDIYGIDAEVIGISLVEWRGHPEFIP